MTIRRARNSGIPRNLSRSGPIHEPRAPGPHFRVVTSEESGVYITLQEFQAEACRLYDEDQGEGRPLTIARQIKTQRAVLSRLWERARALQGLSR